MQYHLSFAFVLSLFAAANGFSMRKAPTMASGRHAPEEGSSQVALVTPMTSSGAVDKAKLRDLLEWHVDQGTDGIVALGTTGEAATMSMAEREEVLTVVTDVCKGKVPTMVGVGTINPDSTVAMAKQAQDCGADSVLLVTPYYVKPTQKGCVKFFNHVAEATDLPMILYNVPGRTACDLLPETVAELRKNPKIVGIKEATGDNSRVAVLRDLCGEDFLLYSGEDSASMDFCLKGGDGSIGVTANVAPAAMTKMLCAAADGDAATAEGLNEPLKLLRPPLPAVEPHPGQVGAQPHGQDRRRHPPAAHLARGRVPRAARGGDGVRGTSLGPPAWRAAGNGGTLARRAGPETLFFSFFSLFATP